MSIKQNFFSALWSAYVGICGLAQRLGSSQVAGLNPTISHVFQHFFRYSFTHSHFSLGRSRVLRNNLKFFDAWTTSSRYSSTLRCKRNQMFASSIFENQRKITAVSSKKVKSFYICYKKVISNVHWTFFILFGISFFHYLSFYGVKESIFHKLFAAPFCSLTLKEWQKD